MADIVVDPSASGRLDPPYARKKSGRYFPQAQLVVVNPDLAEKWGHCRI
jgi:hypothetical protein